MKAVLKTLIQINPKVGVSPIKLFLMRGLYFITFVGLAFQSWNYLLSQNETIDYMTGVAFSFWAAYATLMGLGMFLPLRMLPLVFLQLAYKAIWVVWVYLPLKEQNSVTDVTTYFYQICLIAIALDILVIPWRYTYESFVRPLFLQKARNK
ncbi:MAG: hypothetical protein AAGD17_06185 [Bacteroidota bacterium]